MAYRRHISDLLVGHCVIGLLAQFWAVATTGASWREAGCIGTVCLILIGASIWAQRRSPRTQVTVTFFLGLTTIDGLLYLNGGWDGSHIYPLLWAFSLASCAGLYGSWGLTTTAIGAGFIVAIGGKLMCPDHTFGIGADQTWARVASTCMWWCIALVGAGVTGSRVIRLAEATAEARRGLLGAQAKEHVWASEAEKLRLAAAADRAQALTGLARTFDAQVRSVVGAVAATSASIDARASALSDAASVTGDRVSRTAALSVAVAADVGVMAHGATQLAGSLTHVRGQADGAARAANAAMDQVARSDAALTALIAAMGRVGKAISLIGTIAKRTDLLALNATIESARAGAAGAGFAVVAAEVKLLARRTADATSEIDLLMQQMRAAEENAAAALQSIGQSIGQVDAFAAQVSGAAEDQAAVIRGITHTIAGLGDKMGEVRVQVSDVSSSAAATSEAAQAMLDAAATLRRNAGSLEDEAGAFIASVRAA